MGFPLDGFYLKQELWVIDILDYIREHVGQMLIDVESLFFPGTDVSRISSKICPCFRFITLEIDIRA